MDALLAELELERGLLAGRLETIFLGGGTPTFTRPDALRRLLGSLPPAEEVTVEANPETVTPELAALLREAGVDRVSLGVQSFQPALLSVLDRVAGPDDVRRAFYHLRDAGVDNISFDLIYGIPGQGAAELESRYRRGPEPGAGAPLLLRAGGEAGDALHARARRGARAPGRGDGGLFRDRGAAPDAGRLSLVRDGELLPAGEAAGGRDLRSRHNLAYWLGRDYLGIGIGAVSTVGARRWRNTPRLPAYLEALRAGSRPERELEELTDDVRAVERVMLGLRLDEPLRVNGEERLLDQDALARLTGLGLVERNEGELSLTHRGRLLGGGVTAELLA